MHLFVPPALLLSILIPSLYACLYHLVRGRTLRGLWQGWLVSLLGFGIGQMLGLVGGLPLPTLGQVHLVEGTLACWAALYIAGRWDL